MAIFLMLGIIIQAFVIAYVAVQNMIMGMVIKNVIFVMQFLILMTEALVLKMFLNVDIRMDKLLKQLLRTKQQYIQTKSTSYIDNDNRACN